MSATYYVGDVLEVLPTLPQNSVDLILSSPPFLALRSYLPADHPDKAKEGGSQSTPGEYIDWLIDVVEACGRVLAPHGSLCFELGDTYSGSTMGGGDDRTNERYPAGRSGLRQGQNGFTRSARRDRIEIPRAWSGGHGWPLAKSLSLIPESFRFAMVYGFNPFTGRQTERWRLRNVIRWVRPNPPVGALGDKFRPATSELMVFCKSAKRYFDLDSVRGPLSERSADVSDPRLEPNKQRSNASFNTLGPYDPSHPMLLLNRLRRMWLIGHVDTVHRRSPSGLVEDSPRRLLRRSLRRLASETLGFTDCGHHDYRPGLVLDPFVGSGTTLAVATGHGRNAIGIDLDERNFDLALERVGPLVLQRGEVAA